MVGHHLLVEGVGLLGVQQLVGLVHDLEHGVLDVPLQVAQAGLGEVGAVDGGQEGLDPLDFVLAFGLVLEMVPEGLDFGGQLPLPLGLLLKLLLPQQLLVDRLLVSEVLLVDCTPNLGSCLCWGNRYFPFIDVLHSR